MLRELLTNPQILNPQIEYLLWLQNIRENTGGVLDFLFLKITAMGELLIPTLVMAIIYWCIDVKAGIYLFFLNTFNLFIIQFLKSTACVYRPWVLSDKIKPSPVALPYAGGYSFPSGHTCTAVSVFGGLAYLLRNKKIISIIIAFLVLLVAFSRNFLGVHTPQDVIVSLIVGVITIFSLSKLVDWCEKNKNRYLYVLCAFNIAVILCLYYFCTKSYPIDYVNGKVLVSPFKAVYFSVFYSGWILGLLNGVVLCRRFFPFEANIGSLKNKILRGFIGVLCILVLNQFLQQFILSSVQDFKFTLLYGFLMAFFITAIYPLLFSRVFKRKS